MLFVTVANNVLMESVPTAKCCLISVAAKLKCVSYSYEIFDVLGVKDRLEKL